MFTVFTLANDAILHQFEIFVRSLRRFNPSLDLCVIPFSSEIDKIAPLAEPYGFRIADSDFSVYDQVGRNMKSTRHGAGIFRKYYCFDAAPAGGFLFLDADTLILGDLQPYGDLLQASDVDIVFYQRPKPGRNFRSEEMKNVAALIGESGREGFNSAFFLSRPGVFDKELFLKVSRNGARLKATLVGEANEQAFLSFMTVMTGSRFAFVGELDEQLSPPWNDQRQIVQDKNGGYFFANARNRRPIRALHWGAARWGTGPNEALMEEARNW